MPNTDSMSGSHAGMAAHESNWLPAPAGDASEFSLSIRAYWPETAVIEGRWTPPAVVRCA